MDNTFSLNQPAFLMRPSAAGNAGRPKRKIRLSSVHTVTTSTTITGTQIGSFPFGVDLEGVDPAYQQPFSDIAAKFHQIRARSLRRNGGQRVRENTAFNKALEWITAEAAKDTSASSSDDTSADSLEEGRRADSVLENQSQITALRAHEKTLPASPLAPEKEPEEEDDDEDEQDDMDNDEEEQEDSDEDVEHEVVSEVPVPEVGDEEDDEQEEEELSDEQQEEESVVDEEEEDDASPEVEEEEDQDEDLIDDLSRITDDAPEMNEDEAEGTMPFPADDSSSEEEEESEDEAQVEQEVAAEKEDAVHEMVEPEAELEPEAEPEADPEAEPEAEPMAEVHQEQEHGEEDDEQEDEEEEAAVQNRSAQKRKSVEAAKSAPVGPNKRVKKEKEKENWCPDPELAHLLEKTIVQEEQPVRRYPTRQRVKKLEFWRNQRIRYGRDSTGTCFKVVGVEEGTRSYDPEPKSRKKDKYKNRGSKGSRGQGRRLNLMDLSIHASIDPSTQNNKKWVRKLQKGKHLLESLRDVNFNPSAVSPEVEIALTHKVGTFSRGMLKLKPFATKTRQQTVVPTTIFAVLHGVVAIVVNDEPAVILKTGGSLELQNKTWYSIENLRNDDAVLTFNILRSE